MTDAGKRAPSLARTALTVAVAGVGGALAAALRIPLPWVLGSMFAVAALRLSGHGVPQPMAWRRGAQIVIGTALGLTFTREVVAQVAALWPWLIGGAAFAVAVTMLASRAMQRLASVDAPTAIYAVAVGASAEMALQAQRAGADPALVASAHAVRIVLVVSLASFVAHWSGEHGVVGLTSAALAPLPWHFGLLFLVLSPTVAWLAVRVRLPNGWLLGPVLLTALFASHGLTARLYAPVIIGAQVLIGWSLGQHMTRAFFRKSPRMLLAAMLVTIATLGLCVATAAAVAHGGATTLLTAFLALAPGGTAEMAIVAKTYGIGAIVTTFHFVRVVTMIVAMRWIAAALLRSGWVR